MPWPFSRDEPVKKRRRMGEVAKVDWRERWAAFFKASNRPKPRTPPPTVREKREPVPAKITAYDEHDSQPLQGRALPRWRRIHRVTFWRISRPLRRFHRKVPAAFLVLLYLGLLAAVSGSLIWLTASAPDVTPPVAAAPAVPEKKLTLQPETLAAPQAQLGGKPGKMLTINANVRELGEQMADIEFTAKNYAEAERLYRRLFVKSDRRGYFGFRIYACCLLQNKSREAEDLLPRLLRVGANTPAWHYAMAAKERAEGNAGSADPFLTEARERFGEDACAPYEAVLRQMGPDGDQP